ncbi:hypothetical protein G2W53_017962 [Senna tora]|uniref:SWIM-type domain-containing protein n=1 Tax=Senna tora TaxID=362788 RepID=A0A834TQH0_9FABA|nr:hypothetical protein G2W53_017962 [Senna tora]
MVDSSASLGVLSSSGNMDDNLMNNQSIVVSYENIDETYEYDRIDPSHEKLYIDGEESVGIDEDESSASGSDVEKPKILNIVKNVKGKKNVLRDYIIQENFDIIRIKNEKARVTAICASDGCPWRIHASPSPDGRTFMIKSYEPLHTCIRQFEKNNVTSTWIAEKLKGSLNADPNMSYELMSNEFSTKFGVEAHPNQLYRARRKGKEQVEVAEVESKDSWSYVLEHLYEAIGDERYIIMSDRQKGLTQAVSEIFPNSWHRHCSKHLLNNFKAKFPLLILRAFFRMAVKATNEFIFRKAMEKMKKHNENAYQYLMDMPLHTWSKHAFHESCKSPHITNNVCESFNDWINELRSMTVLNLVDGLRAKIMMRFYTKSITSWPQSVGPRIVKTINETIVDARFCRVKLAGRNLYELYDGFTRFLVDLVSQTCECKAWKISGLPCKHGTAAIIYIRAKVEDYCDSYYSKEKYTTTYSGLVSPLPNLNTLEEIEVLPPPLRRLLGRPKKSRRREKDEVAPSDVRRRLSTVKCTNCEMLGHNKRSCQSAQVKAKKRKQGALTSASQTSTRREIPKFDSVQARAKSQLQAKQTKRNIREDTKKNPSNPTTQESVSDVARDVNGS